MNKKSHFNKLTPAEHERLAFLSEECAEVIQAIGKIMRHGYKCSHPNRTTTNKNDLEREIGHVIAAYELMTIFNVVDLDMKNISNSRNEKLNTVRTYFHHQE